MQEKSEPELSVFAKGFLSCRTITCPLLCKTMTFFLLLTLFKIYYDRSDPMIYLERVLSGFRKILRGLDLRFLEDGTHKRKHVYRRQ